MEKRERDDKEENRLKLKEKGETKWGGQLARQK